MERELSGGEGWSLRCGCGSSEVMGEVFLGLWLSKENRYLECPEIGMLGDSGREVENYNHDSLLLGNAS